MTDEELLKRTLELERTRALVQEMMAEAHRMLREVAPTLNEVRDLFGRARDIAAAAGLPFTGYHIRGMDDLFGYMATGEPPWVSSDEGWNSSGCEWD